jgi:hypothetical protein
LICIVFFTTLAKNKYPQNIQMTFNTFILTTLNFTPNLISPRKSTKKSNTLGQKVYRQRSVMENKCMELSSGVLHKLYAWRNRGGARQPQKEFCLSFPLWPKTNSRKSAKSSGGVQDGGY